MNVSANELNALLSRTFESICGNYRDFDEAACAVTWMSQCGWDSIEQLVRSIDSLSAVDYRQSPEIENFAETTLVDLAGESLFTAGAMITDTGMARLAENGECRIVITSPLHPEAVLGYLSRYSDEFRACVHACWTVSGTKYLVRKHTDDDFAEIWTRSEVQKNQSASNGMMQILFSAGNPVDVKSPDALPEIPALLGSLSGMTRSLSSAELASRFSAAFDSGISIQADHYQVLYRVADAVLIPTSETSRRGAGD